MPYNCAVGISRFAVAAAMVMAPACGDDGMTTPPQKWEIVAQDQPAALLSVWAGSPTNVWVVGGSDGTGPIVEHYDGTTWTKFDTGLGPMVDLWWVKGFDDGRILMSGSHSTIVSTTDGSSFTPMTTPAGTVTVFGMWGASSTQVWAVGGTGASGAFAWQGDGSTWTAYPTIPTGFSTVWKVNGLAADNIWFSGTNGMTAQWNGSILTPYPVAAAQEQQDSLFSIDVTSQHVITVGGTQIGMLFERPASGGDWTAPVSALPPLSGVAASEDVAYAVGAGGNVFRRDSSGKWTNEKTDTIQSLHAVHIDPTGEVWAVGGLFNATPTSQGVLLHKGPALKGTFQ